MPTEWEHHGGQKDAFAIAKKCSQVLNAFREFLPLMVLWKGIKMMTFEEFVKLILRTGPYVLSNPEISNCPIPEDMHLFPNGKKKQNKDEY